MASRKRLSTTNLVTVDGAKITSGQKGCTDAALQLTTETGPLPHGIYLVPLTSANYYVNCSGTTGTEVTAANGVLIKANNPLFIPIRDPSVIRIISTAATKTMPFLMY